MPVAVLDVLAPLVCGVAGMRAATSPHLKLRKWLSALLKASLLLGNIANGIYAHDLLRDISIRRAEAAREGGLGTLQREVVPLLLAALDAGGAAASYILSGLHWHVRQAQKPDLAIHSDAMLMSVLSHKSADVRKQGATGIGVDKLSSAADACEKSGEHLQAAQLLWAVCSVRGQAADTELRRAWAAIKELEAAGRGSLTSRALESRVLNMLNLHGRYAFRSDEHNEALARLKQLASMQETVSSHLVDGSAADKEIMEVEHGLALTAAFASWSCENVSGYSGPVTREGVEQSYTHLCEHAEHDLKAVAAAPDQASAMAMRSMYSWAYVAQPRMHALSTFSPVSAFGEGGARLRDTVER